MENCILKKLRLSDAKDPADTPNNKKVPYMATCALTKEQYTLHRLTADEIPAVLSLAWEVFPNTNLLCTPRRGVKNSADACTMKSISRG